MEGHIKLANNLGLAAMSPNKFGKGFGAIGLKIPKHIFVEYYKSEKGNWPTELAYGAAQETHSAHLTKNRETKTFLSEQEFIDKDTLYGVKVLGEPYIDRYNRRANFEIFSYPECAIDVNSLHDLTNYRKFYSLGVMNGGIASMFHFSSENTDFLCIEDYLKGEFDGMTKKEIEYGCSIVKQNWIALLSDIESKL